MVQLVDSRSSVALAERVSCQDLGRLVQMAPGTPALQMATTLSNLQFWGDLDRMLTLLLPIRDIAQALQADRPTLSQCLPLWNVIRDQVRVTEKPMRPALPSVLLSSCYAPSSQRRKTSTPCRHLRRNVTFCRAVTGRPAGLGYH